MSKKDSYLPFAESAALASKGHPPRRPETLYFAYGSNLHLEQMARRCPTSRFIGRAILHNYRWQINSRGFANVIEAEGHKVEGLVYLLESLDGVALDAAEGVPYSYQKEWLEVKLFNGGAEVVGRSVAELVDGGVLKKALGESEENLSTKEPSEKDSTGTADAGKKMQKSPGKKDSPKRNPLSPHKDGELVKVLVYVDNYKIREGLPRLEYITRIKNGIADAVALGVAKGFTDGIMLPKISQGHR